MTGPSNYAQRQLQFLLLDVAAIAPGAFRTFLLGNGYRGNALAINFDGPPIDVYSGAIGSLANAGVLDEVFFDLLATLPALVRHGDEIARLRVEFEIDEPPMTHFGEARLNEIVVAAELADLHSGARYAALATKTPHELRQHSAGRQAADPQWVGALFRAANRQMPRPGDPEIWMADLLGLSAELAEDNAGAHETFVNALAELQLGYVDDTRVGERLVARGGSLQRIVTPNGFAVDAGALDDWLGDVRSRTCLIRVGGADTGTGLLVGPDLILTNWHVLAKVIKGSVVLGKQIGGTVHASTVRFVFDYTTVDGGETDTVETRLADADADEQPWLLDWAPAADAEIPADANPPVDEPTDADLVDFALVRIDGDLGAERGWFAISDSEFGFAVGAPIVIAGHPVEIDTPGTIYSTKKKAKRLVCSIAGQSSLGVNEPATRVRYRTNTNPGSSGSPVFNDEFDFVALHHFGNEGTYNQGIPITAIHRRLARENKLDELGG